MISLDYSKHRSHIYFYANKKENPAHWTSSVIVPVASWVTSPTGYDAPCSLSSKTYISHVPLVLHVAVLCLQTNSTFNGAKANNEDEKETMEEPSTKEY